MAHGGSGRGDGEFDPYDDDSLDDDDDDDDGDARSAPRRCVVHAYVTTVNEFTNSHRGQSQIAVFSCVILVKPVLRESVCQDGSV